MTAEVWIWMAVNLTTLAVTSRELWGAWGDWMWVRGNVTGQLRSVARRNVRAAGLRTAIACLFVGAGSLAFIPWGRGWIVWLLVGAAICLAIDTLVESHYRKTMFGGRHVD